MAKPVMKMSPSFQDIITKKERRREKLSALRLKVYRAQSTASRIKTFELINDVLEGLIEILDEE